MLRAVAVAIGRAPLSPLSPPIDGAAQKSEKKCVFIWFDQFSFFRGCGHPKASLTFIRGEARSEGTD